MASYFFFINSVYVVAISVVYMGIESNILMQMMTYLFAVVLFYGRLKLFKHALIWGTIFILSIIVIISVFPYHSGYLTPYQVDVLKYANIIVAFFFSVCIVAYITWFNINNEKKIWKYSEERQLLLAELFHRVKNNLNIVISLINLRKDNTNSLETIEALEECKSRIYSMALIHAQMFKGDKLGKLCLIKFLDELIGNIETAYNVKAKTEIEIKVDDLIIPISKAIPIGLILNELITNSYKHGKQDESDLDVAIHVKQETNNLRIFLSDNGPGLPQDYKNNSNSLGFELIENLCLQIDGTFNIEKTRARGAGFIIYISDIVKHKPFVIPD